MARVDLDRVCLDVLRAFAQAEGLHRAAASLTLALGLDEGALAMARPVQDAILAGGDALEAVRDLDDLLRFFTADAA